MRISDWSSDVCSSDLHGEAGHLLLDVLHLGDVRFGERLAVDRADRDRNVLKPLGALAGGDNDIARGAALIGIGRYCRGISRDRRSEEHTSELQSLMRISYAVFCLKKKKEKESDEANTHST